MAQETQDPSLATAIEVFGLQTLVRNWWVVALRGVAALLFGILALARPAAGLAVVIVLFGAYALVDGILAMVSSVRAAAHRESWGALLFEGVVGVAAGVATFVWPALTGLVLLFIIAFWAIVTGILELVAAVRLRHLVKGEWLLGLSGIFSLLFGILVLARPAAGAVGVMWLLGIYGLLFGFALLGLAFRLQSLSVNRIAEAH